MKLWTELDTLAKEHLDRILVVVGLLCAILSPWPLVTAGHPQHPVAGGHGAPALGSYQASRSHHSEPLAVEEGHYSPTQELYGSSTLLQPFIPGEQVPLPWLLPGKGGGGGEADQA